MTRIYDSLKASAAAEFIALTAADGKLRDPAHVLTETVDSAMTKLSDHQTVLSLLSERPDVLTWFAPAYSRPSDVATYVFAAVRHRVREELVSELMLDALMRFYDVSGTYLSAVRAVVGNCAVIAGALPHEVPEFFEIDFGWYGRLSGDGITRDALDALIELSAAMKHLIFSGTKFEPRVVGLCGPAADDMTARMLALVGTAADYHGAALAARVADELAEERLSTARQMV